MKRFLYKLATDQGSGFGYRFLQFLLFMLSFIFAFLVFLRRQLYRHNFLKSVRLPRPVISVGNIALGGVGKTPLVVTISQYLLSQKKQPAVLMRGYMDRPSKAQESHEIFSDEAQMLRKQVSELIVLTGKDRAASATAFLEKGDADIFLLDDGFQHLRLKRDLDIVCVDAANPFGNGQLLPRGILREYPSALNRADVMVLTKTNLVEDLNPLKKILKQIQPRAALVESVHDPVGLYDVRLKKFFQLEVLGESPYLAFSSIGDGNYFVKTLQSFGPGPMAHDAFIDHYTYTQQDLQWISDECMKKGAKAVVTTAKDAVKCENLLHCFSDHLQVYCLEIQCKLLKGEDVFFERISALLHR